MCNIELRKTGRRTIGRPMGTPTSALYHGRGFVWQVGILAPGGLRKAEREEQQREIDREQEERNVDWSGVMRQTFYSS